MHAGEGPYRTFRIEVNALKNNNKNVPFVFAKYYWSYPRGRSGGMHKCCDISLSFSQCTLRGRSKESGRRCEDNIKIEFKETSRVLTVWAGFIRFRIYYS